MTRRLVQPRSHRCPLTSSPDRHRDLCAGHLRGGDAADHRPAQHRPAALTGLGWSLLAILFCSAIPYVVIWVGVRRGRLTDHHIGVREQRRMPLVYGLLSVLVGLAVLVLAGTPRPLIPMVVVMFAVLLIVTAINRVWKPSAHAAVAAGSISVLVIAFGPALVPSLALVALVGWSRLRLGDHTTRQVVAGALAGILLAVPTIVLLS
ncbi:hypothetical protein [Micromonospora sp. DT31]|uniref:hypothetical protein n=1 Tax=Micromonospora sp. DT31 TaxID=3393434 RepID=UPI003CE6EB05